MGAVFAGAVGPEANGHGAHADGTTSWPSSAPPDTEWCAPCELTLPLLAVEPPAVNPRTHVANCGQTRGGTH